jgi:hypothetical protein
MANQNSPHGFAVLGTQQGNDWASACHMYEIPSTDATNTYSIGDVVASAANSDASNPWGTFGIPAVTKPIGTPNVSAIPRGVVISMFRNPFSLDTMYVPQVKAANYYVLIMDDPFAIMEAIPDGSASFSATTWLNNNTGFTQAAVNAATVSNTTLSSSPATTSTFPVKLISVAQRPNISTGLYVPLVCMFNTHELKSVGTTGV